MRRKDLRALSRVGGVRYYRPVPMPGRRRYVHLVLLGMALEWLFVLLLVATAAASAYGIYWVFTAGGWKLLQVKIAVTSALGAVVLSVIPCLFVFRQRFRPFGLEVPRGAHPRLWEEIGRVAMDLNAKPPDIIF